MRKILVMFLFVWGLAAQTLYEGNIVLQGNLNYATSSTGTDAYEVTLTREIISYQPGLIVFLKVDVANTGACTLAVNGLTPKSIVTVDGSTPSDGDLTAGEVRLLIYDGTRFQLIGSVGTGGGGGGGGEPPYITTKSSSTTWSVPGATHGLGTDVQVFVDFDNTSTWRRLEPSTVDVNKSTGDVTVTFAEARAGRIMITQLSGSTGSPTIGDHTLLSNLNCADSGHTNIPCMTTSNTYTAGAKQRFRPSGSTSGINIECTSLPASPTLDDYACDSADGNQLKHYNGSSWDAIGTVAGVSSWKTRTGAVVPANDDYTASQVTNVPAGTIGATNVQDAINELNGEKAALSHTHVEADITNLSHQHPTSIFASLPAASSATNKVYLVTDCNAKNCTTGGGAVRVTMVSDGSTWTPSAGDGASGGGGSGGHTIMDEGVALPARTNLDFVGAGVSCVDVSGSDKSRCTVSSGSSGGVSGPLSVASDGTYDGERVATGSAGITITDNGANSTATFALDCTYAGCQGFNNDFSGSNKINLGTDYLSETWPANASTPPQQYRVVTWTGDPLEARNATTSSSDKIAGVCVTGCNSTGPSRIAVSGKIYCMFDSAPTAGNWALLSTSTAGNCVDGGSSSTRPSSRVVGVVDSSAASSGAYLVRLRF